MKWAGPVRSPFVAGSSVPDSIRATIRASQEAEFYKYRQVIADPSNPLVGVRVITNSEDSAAYFREIMAKLGIPGEVQVR